MLTYEKVFELFHEYLEMDSCIEVISTRWGYVRLFCEPPYLNTVEAVLCRTPEELFKELLDDYLIDQEYQLARIHGCLTQGDRKTLESLREMYQKKINIQKNSDT